MAKTKKKPVKLTPEMAARIKRAIRLTWQAISYDICGEGSIPRSEAIEVTLDADYCELYGDDHEAVKVLRSLSNDKQDELAREVMW